MRRHILASDLSAPQPRRGLTVLELLVTMGLVTILMALVLPAVQFARETARRTQCQNNLRQLGLAMHQHHDIFGHLPAGWTDVSGAPAASGWILDLLPYLEQTALREHVRSEWPTTLLPSPGSNSGLMQTPTMLICPSDVAAATFELFEETDIHSEAPSDPLSETLLMELPHSNYVGLFGTADPDQALGSEGDGVFIQGRAIAFRDLTNGLSNVATVGERTARRLPSTWLGFHLAGEDGPGRVAGFALFGPNHPKADECELDSRHPGGINLVFADGHLQFVADSVDALIYRQMAKRWQ